jgi:superoxide dismutase
VFNNAAQVWNHTFYWHSLSPKATAPTGNLFEAIERDFGSVEQVEANIFVFGRRGANNPFSCAFFFQFKNAFSGAAAGQFGSGWAWLVASKAGKLSVVKTSNAETPMTNGYTALLTCDVWEHAYYLDYQNDRTAYINGFWKLCNWSKKNFEKVKLIFFCLSGNLRPSTLTTFNIFIDPETIKMKFFSLKKVFFKKIDIFFDFFL